jgi:hypothetical protein
MESQSRSRSTKSLPVAQKQKKKSTKKGNCPNKAILPYMVIPNNTNR